LQPFDDVRDDRRRLGPGGPDGRLSRRVALERDVVEILLAGSRPGPGLESSAAGVELADPRERDVVGLD